MARNGGVALNKVVAMIVGGGFAAVVLVIGIIQVLQSMA